MNDQHPDQSTASFAGPPVEPPLPGPVPGQFGPVRLIRPLGEGGMGVVWLGHHELLGRDVAVKLLLQRSASPGDPALIAFLRGARAAAALRHPGINEVFHADVVNGVPYLVLELLDGPTLSEVVRRAGPLPLPVARTVLACVCRAVSELHDHELIHRDIKPANIMLTSEGRVVLTDFGLASPRAPTAAGAGSTSGTPAYMAPEMFDGVVSSRTDVYALGISAYHLLAGRPPFEGAIDELRRQHRERPLDPAPLRERAVPEAVIEAIVRAANKDGLFRSKSARHVLAALEDGFERAGIVPAGAEDLVKFAARPARPARPARDDQAHAPVSPASSASYYERISDLKARKPSRAVPNAAPSEKPPECPPESPPVRDQDRFSRAPERRRALLVGIAVSLAGAIPGVLCLYFAFRSIPLVEQQLLPPLVAGSSPSLRSQHLWLNGALQVASLLPASCLMIAILIPLYRLCRGPRTSAVRGRTECGWCEYELRGLREPRCPECGHALGDPGPDAAGLLPPGARRASILSGALAYGAWVWFFIAALLASAIVLASINSLVQAAIRMLSQNPPGRDASPDGAPTSPPESVGWILGSLMIAVAGAVTLWMYEFSAHHDMRRSGRCWCRVCGNELRDLTQPICPRCATPI